MNISQSQPLNNEISSIIIDDFNIYESWHDKVRFREVIDALFAQAKSPQIFFQFRREESLFLSNKAILEYRDEIPNHFGSHGRYKVVRKIDEVRFDSFGVLENNQRTIDYIPILWNYFYSCDFFVPTLDLTFDYLISHYNDLMDDIDGLTLFKNDLIDLICIKGLGGDYLTINYRNTYEMPNLKNIVSSRPTLR